jgi:uncharacterized membrane protein YczE
MMVKCFYIIKKSLIVTFGMLLLGIGINFVLIANIGTDAVTAAVNGIYHLIGSVSFGTAQIIFGITFVGAGFLLDKKKVGIGTVIATFAAGIFIDLFQPYIRQILPTNPNFMLSILILLIGLVINGIAIAVYLSADFGIGAGEILAVIVAEKNVWQFRYVKIGSDIIMLAFGFLCGAAIGSGTIISALIIGPIVQMALPYSRRITSRLL